MTAASHYLLFYMHISLGYFQPNFSKWVKKWYWLFFLKNNFSNNFGLEGDWKGSLIHSKTWKYLGLTCRNESNYMEIFWKVLIKISSSMKVVPLKVIFRAQSNICDGAFLQISSTVDVRLGFKHASTILYWHFVLTTGWQDSQLK